MQVLISHTPDLPNRIRIEPNLDASTIAKIYPGETAEIIEGPACANGLTWWKIKTEQTDTTGWTVEGDAKSYWLIPCTDASACKTALLPSNLQDGLVLYLPFENTLNDFSDQGNDVTGHGAIAYTTGVLGQAAYFDGQDDWVEVSQGMNVGNQFTFSMVLRTPNLEAFLLQKGETCPDGKPDYLGTAYLVYLGKSYQGNYQSTGENGHLNVFLVAESGGPNDERIVSTSTQLLIPSTFQHILIVYQYPVITYYVNGKQIDRRIVYEKGGAGRSVPIAPQDFLGIHQTSSSLKIGVNESYCNRIHDFFSHFNGILDELRIYDRALGLEEIQELFQSYNITP